jgi:hypothetical protein
MKPQASTFPDDFDDPLITTEGDVGAHEDDLWFLPGPLVAFSSRFQLKQ